MSLCVWEKKSSQPSRLVCPSWAQTPAPFSPVSPMRHSFTWWKRSKASEGPGMTSTISIFPHVETSPRSIWIQIFGNCLRPARHVALSQTGAAQYYNTICMLKRWPLLCGCAWECACLCLCTHRPVWDVWLTGQPLWPLCRGGEATCFQSIID